MAEPIPRIDLEMRGHNTDYSEASWQSVRIPRIRELNKLSLYDNIVLCEFKHVLGEWRANGG